MLAHPDNNLLPGQFFGHCDNFTYDFSFITKSHCNICKHFASHYNPIQRPKTHIHSITRKYRPHTV